MNLLWESIEWQLRLTFSLTQQRELLQVLVYVLEAALGLAVRVNSPAEQVPLVIAVKVVVHDPVVELVVASIEVRVSEEASLHHVVSEEGSLLQLCMDVWQCPRKRSLEHGSVWPT